MSKKLSVAAVSAFALAMGVGSAARADAYDRPAAPPVFLSPGAQITVGQGVYTFPALPAAVENAPYALTGNAGDRVRTEEFWNQRTGTSISVGQGNYLIPQIR